MEPLRQNIHLKYRAAQMRADVLDIYNTKIKNLRLTIMNLEKGGVR